MKKIYLTTLFMLSMLHTFAWGPEQTVRTTAVFGKFGFAAKSSSVLYVSVSDSLNSSFLINTYKSVNSGLTWTVYRTDTLMFGRAQKIKLLKSDQDSIICTYIEVDTVRWFNLESVSAGRLNLIAGHDYDAITLPSGGLCFLLTVKQATGIADYGLRRYTTVDGQTWTMNGLIATAKISPVIYRYPGTDTVILAYHDALTQKTRIRTAAYRVNGPASLASLSQFRDVMAPDSVRRTEINIVRIHGNIWVFTTEGEPGGRRVTVRHNLNAATNYSAPLILSDTTRVCYNISAVGIQSGNLSEIAIAYLSHDTSVFSTTPSSSRIEIRSSPIASPLLFTQPYLPLINNTSTLFDGFNDANVVFSITNNNGTYLRELVYPNMFNRLQYNRENNVTGFSEQNYTKTTPRIYPNPGKGQFFIDHDDLRIEIARVYDSRGVLCKEILSETNGLSEIDLTGMKSGLYILEIISDKVRSTHRLIIE